MSTPTPPGWYPVPGTTEERWWDGTAWTANTRPVPAPRLADAPTQAWSGSATPPPPATPPNLPPNANPNVNPNGWPGMPPGMPPAGPPARKGVVIGSVVASLAVIGGAIAAAIAFVPGLTPGPGPKPTPIASGSRSALPTPRPSGSRVSPQPAPSATVAMSGKTYDDRVHGWSVPLPAGWNAQLPNATATVYLNVGQYNCGLSSPCVRGQFSVEAAAAQGTEVGTVAETAMAAYAQRTFGQLADHKELSATATSVAGTLGYALHWRVTPTTGADGYLLLIAVPAPTGGYTILHGGVDTIADSPPPAVLDQIAAGIRKLGTTSGT